MTFYKHNNLAKLGQSLALELFWLKDELIRMYSNDTNACERCGAHSQPRKKLQIHHRKHDGDTERFQWEMNTNLPHVMGYYYNMWFQFKANPVVAKQRYGVLCPKCNRIDHIAREAVAKGNTQLQSMIVDKPPILEPDDSDYSFEDELDIRIEQHRKN